LRRSAFLGSAATLAAAAFLRDVAFAADSSSTDTDLAPLIETLLPFGTPSFPGVESGSVIQRINSLFRLGDSPVFQASLRAFSYIPSFTTGAEELNAAERFAVPEANVQELRANDAAAIAAIGLPSSGWFKDLGPADRNAYVRLWSQSAFSTRRRFYGSVRAVTFIAFYSIPETWTAIDYAGPILNGSHLP
jgi:hypothetical protein